MSPPINRSLVTLPRLLSGYPAAAAVLVACFLLAAASVREKSNTFDEIAHVTAGLSYWTENDYRLHPENGNLPQRWFALPLLRMGLKLPKDEAAWNTANVWVLGDQLFFQLGNDLETLLWRARCMNALLAAALGGLVYAWSRRWFGPAGGMLSLLLYATNPTILANGSLATSDLAAAAFFTAAVGCLWKMFHKLSAATFIGAGLAFSGLFLSKMSAWFIVPTIAAMLALRLTAGIPLTVAWRGGVVIRSRAVQAVVLSTALLVQAVLVIAAIWAFYGFRYSAFHPPLSGKEHFDTAWKDELANTGAFGRTIELARANRLLPEAYLYGTTFAYHHAQQRCAFLDGRYSLTGWWWFFPYTFLVKTPLVLFLVFILAARGALARWRQGRSCQPRAVLQGAWQAFYAAAPLWIFMAIYWGAAINSRLNIGHRHILPTYPAMFILCGAAGHWFGRQGRLGWAMRAAIIGCLVALAVDCFASYPHYLAYFNRIAGGPSNAYKHLIDSSLDWGQDLPGLKRWLVEHDLDDPRKTPVYLSYFGTANPTYYKIHATEVSGGRPRLVGPLTEGVYALSATNVERLYQLFPGRWSATHEKAYQEAVAALRTVQSPQPAMGSPLLQSVGEPFANQAIALFDDLRMGRLCAHLRQREPDDNVGYSLLIYRVSADEIRQALFGPPPELVASSPEQFATADFHYYFACLLGQCGKLDEAISELQQAIKIQPFFPDAHYKLGAAFCKQGKMAEAVAHWREVIRLQPNNVALRNTTAWILATDPDASVRNGREAVEMARQAVQLCVAPDPAVLDTLAAAFAESGRFSEAVQTAKEALALAACQNNTALADKIEARIGLYRSAAPCRDAR